MLRNDLIKLSFNVRVVIFDHLYSLYNIMAHPNVNH